ncbi:hypothetical protein ACRU3B_14305 [Mycobacterium colombiense]|uniref:hypothetical protein n=1 Tax=Mycobacterium colombiense TaxID=339268 RepID=UPI001930C516|nr:hypothetical protein [Mycobacterium colombiense]
MTVLPVTAASATIADLLIPHHETWVAVLPGSVVGLLALDTEELEQLYPEPTWRGRGPGDRLVELTKQRRPHGLRLWTSKSIPQRSGSTYGTASSRPIAPTAYATKNTSPTFA